MGAYVEGRPIPYSSRVRTKVASVKRGGGWVKCCSGISCLSCCGNPSLRPAGIRASSSSAVLSSSLASSYTARKPRNLTVEPEARSKYSWALPFPLTSTDKVSKMPGAICEAKNRCQINWYRRNWSRFKNSLIASGVRITEVGRIASWASWAPSTLVLYVGGLGGKKDSPNRSWIYWRASSCAISATLVESVRM